MPQVEVVLEGFEGHNCCSARRPVHIFDHADAFWKGFGGLGGLGGLGVVWEGLGGSRQAR